MDLQKENEELREELRVIKESPYYQSYKSALIQIKYWDVEIGGDPVSIKGKEEEDTRLFDKALKYLLEQPKLYANLEALRQRILPQDLAKIEKEATSTVDEIRKQITDEFRSGLK